MSAGRATRSLWRSQLNIGRLGGRSYDAIGNGSRYVNKRQSVARALIAAAVVTVVWIGLASARIQFSEQLPELDQIFDRSQTLAGLGFALVATFIATLLPKRSLERSLITYGVSATLATVILGQAYWKEVNSFTPGQLAAARQRRLSEIIAAHQAEQMSDDTLPIPRLKAKAAPSDSVE